MTKFSRSTNHKELLAIRVMVVALVQALVNLVQALVALVLAHVDQVQGLVTMVQALVPLVQAHPPQGWLIWLERRQVVVEPGSGLVGSV